jgi:hypothetical protein
MKRESDYVHDYHRPLDKLIGNGSIYEARLPVYSEYCILNSNMGKLSDIDKMKVYLDDIISRHKLLKLAAERREEHYSIFILNQKDEDTGHQIVRELLNLYSQEGSEMIEYYQSIYDQMLSEFFDSPNSRNNHSRKAMRNNSCSIGRNTRTDNNKDDTKTRNLITKGYQRKKIPNRLKAGEMMKNQIWTAEIQNYVDGIIEQNNTSIENSHYINHVNFALFSYFTFFAIETNNPDESKHLTLINETDDGNKSYGFTVSQMIILHNIAKFYLFYGDTESVYEKASWIDKMQITSENFYKQSIFNQDIIQPKIHVIIDKLKIIPHFCDECDTQLNKMMSLDMFTQSQIVPLFIELADWIRAREIVMENEIIKFIQMNNRKNDDSITRIAPKRYHNTKYQRSIDKISDTILYTDYAIAYLFFIMCFSEKIPYVIYRALMDPTHYQKAWTFSSNMDHSIMMNRDNLRAEDKAFGDKPHFDYSRILNAFTNTIKIQYGCLSNGKILFKFFQQIFSFDDILYEQIESTISASMINNLTNKRIF